MNQLSIFYDGSCHVCSWEVGHYLKMDKSRKLKTIDINSLDFDASKYNLDPARVRKYFHILRENGEVITGVDAFIEIWKTLGTPLSLKASRLARIAPIHKMMELGYAAFTEIRPYLPRKPGTPNCDTGSCSHR